MARHGADRITAMHEPSCDLPLICHPATPAPMVSRLDARVELLPGRHIKFHYCLRGDMARLRIPAEAPVQRADRLWEHTCFEAFVGLRDAEDYREFNFSPSGQWATYAFAGYRRPTPENPPIPAPDMTVCATPGRLELAAVVSAVALPTSPVETWLIGLCAVVEAVDTVTHAHSYWALRHPSARPDFHHREGFILNVSDLLA